MNEPTFSLKYISKFSNVYDYFYLVILIKEVLRVEKNRIGLKFLEVNKYMNKYKVIFDVGNFNIIMNENIK